MSMQDLGNLLDALAETSVYVIEESTHKILYFNKICGEMSKGRAAIGKKCHEIWPEVCGNCPLNGLEKQSFHRSVCYNPLQKTMVDLTANRIVWQETIPAVVLTVSPHQLNFEEEQGLRKIEQMYAQSLVTVFDECIIANLTSDYYVNCQKDMMWTEIPEQGNFGIENQNYAQKVIHPEDLQMFRNHFSRESMLRLFGEGKRQICKRIRRMTSEGVYHMVEFAATRIERLGDDECWCVLVFRDVQDEYLLEQKRNVEISQLATAARAAYQMLIAVNVDQNTYEMLEYERYPVKRPEAEGCFDDLIAFEMDTVHPNYKDEFYRKFSRQKVKEAFLNGESVLSMEVPHLGEDGSYHWNFTQVVQVKSLYSDDMMHITLSRNIDREKKSQEELLLNERRTKQILEDALQKAEKASQAKSDFLSKMSHDIRTPLNAVIGMTELAQLNLAEEEKLKDYLNKIESSGKHLLGIINEVLDVSKIESGAAELEETEFDLHHLAESAAEMVRLSFEEKQQTFIMNLDEKIHSRVIGDVNRIKQILVNILENASKYTENKGEIIFSLKQLKQQEKQIGTYIFSFEDTGVGMTEEYLKHIFEPFSRAYDTRIHKVAGTGLGMTIVKNLISMMGGEIQVESEYGKGSKFTITLYLSKCSSVTVEEPTEKMYQEKSFVGMRALLVEDNELNCEIATEMLELLGITVESVKNGQKAVEAVCSHVPFYYDIVFMDIQMPILNGYEATKKIRNSGIERIDELPIIAMTADAFAEDIKLAKMAGMNGHLAKPISVERLKHALSEYLVWKQENKNI